MHRSEEFFNLYHHDFIRVAVAIPEVRVADPAYNVEQTIKLLGEVAERDAILALFPELGISAYSCEDLFHQQALQAATMDALREILKATQPVPVVGIVGMPLCVEHLLYNCAIIFCQGSILGIVPKTYLPNYREFYELRQFTPADTSSCATLDLCGQRAIPFGNRLLFEMEEQSLLRFHVELCEDLWVPIPPSAYAALAGATVLLNLSASNITIGKAAYRRELVSNQSARCLSAYLYSTAGTGESTTDLAWDGHALIYENGSRLAESERFSYQARVLYAELDLLRLSCERMRQNSFAQAVRRHREMLKDFRTIKFSLKRTVEKRLLLEREYERFPYVPADPLKRDERCFEAYQIQVQGLAKRLQASGIRKLVLGVSGGLDSAQALIVSARAMDLLGLPRDHILAYTMPGFATSERTLAQAKRLIRALGCAYQSIDIRPSCEQMLKNIDHPHRIDVPVYDTTFENVQAGERTSHLFRLANLHNALVVGTSDLSELALGWCTYGIGDHMSHYNVNASIPKTLIQYLLRWVADTEQCGQAASQVLLDILDTEISPELVPGEGSASGPAQKTEAVIGPYELQDFTLYYALRYGYAPPRLAFLAYCAWHDRGKGAWPNIPTARRNAYTLAQIKHYLRIFLLRFFKQSQFKRSCLPNAPKVGSGGSLSPRGDYRAPSDSEASAWIAQLERIPECD
jgi:NAD+ synthetase